MNRAQDRAVRMALLQAKAEVERIELARNLAEVREAAEPRAILQNLLPATPLAGWLSRRRESAAPGARGWMGEVVEQVTTVYNQYPLLWSTAASFVFRRTRFRRLFRLLGFALAAQRALRLGKSLRR